MLRQMIGARSLCTARLPGLRGKVNLAPKSPCRGGLVPGELLLVVAHDMEDAVNPYRVQHPDHLEKCGWYGAEHLVLVDASASPVPPEPPGSNTCCGSDCPNCVWIQYWRECQEWEAVHGKEAGGEQQTR